MSSCNTGTAPHRLFIRDAIVRQATTAGKAMTSGKGGGLYVRLMGRVTTVTASSAASAASCSRSNVENNQQQESFVIDDGTASVQVMVLRSCPPTRTCTLPTTSAAGSAGLHSNKRPKLVHVGFSGGKNGNSIGRSVGLVHGQQRQQLPELGSLVDCVGYLTLPDSNDDDGDEDENVASSGKSTTTTCITEGNDAKEGEGDQETETVADKVEEAAETDGSASTSTSTGTNITRNHRRLARLSAVGVIPVSNQDAESLRTLELLLIASNKSSSAVSPMQGQGVVVRYNGDGTGMHTAGDLLSKIGAFRSKQRAASSNVDDTNGGVGGVDTAATSMKPTSNTRSRATPTYSISSSTAFRLIKSAASDGGLTEEDIAIVLGCSSGHTNGMVASRRGRTGATEAGAMAVREVLLELQLGGEIYKTRRGTYLPL